MPGGVACEEGVKVAMPSKRAQIKRRAVDLNSDRQYAKKTSALILGIYPYSERQEKQSKKELLLD